MQDDFRKMDYSPPGEPMRRRLPLSSVVTRGFLRESLDTAVLRSPPPTSFQGMVTPAVLSHLQELEERNFGEALYTNTQQIFFADLTFKGVLGQGRCSTVFHVQLPSTTTDVSMETRPDYYALKCLRPDRIQMYAKSKEKASMKTSTAFAAAAEELYREATLLAKCHHPNIISLRGAAKEGLVGSVTVAGEAGSCREEYGYFIALDIISETLAQRISKWRQSTASLPFKGITRRLSKSLSASPSSSRASRPLVASFRSLRTVAPPATDPSSTTGSDADARGDLAERIEIATAIASAMEYLHTKHRCVILDLCPESIGFDAKTGEVKLFDLGLARTREQAILHMQPDRGNPRYTAPEIMICQSSGFPGDVYSFGVLLWELVTLQRPYEAFFATESTEKLSSSPRKEVFQQSRFTAQVILNKQWRPSCTSISDPETRRLIQECWCADPEARPNAEQVLWRLEQTIQQPRRGSFAFRRTSHQSQTSSVSWPTDGRGRTTGLLRGLRGSFRKSLTDSTPGTVSTGAMSDIAAAAAAVAADPLSYLDDFEEPSFQAQQDDSMMMDHSVGMARSFEDSSFSAENEVPNLSLSELRSRLGVSSLISSTDTNSSGSSNNKQNAPREAVDRLHTLSSAGYSLTDDAPVLIAPRDDYLMDQKILLGPSSKNRSSSSSSSCRDGFWEKSLTTTTMSNAKNGGSVHFATTGFSPQRR